MDKTQIKELDRLLREACFKRDNYKCIRCGKDKNLSPSHIYPKGTYRKMRWNLDNVKTLCWRCHLEFWHKNPIEAHEWLKTVIPEDRLKKLKLSAQYIDKTPLDYKLIKLYLENQ